MISKIEAALRVLIPSAKPIVFDCIPNRNPFSQIWTARGKFLFQYDPAQALLPNPTNACNEIRQAMARVWIEDIPIYAYQNYWIAEPDKASWSLNPCRIHVTKWRLTKALPRNELVITSIYSHHEQLDRKSGLLPTHRLFICPAKVQAAIIINFVGPVSADW
jgi:hypothetical protein